MTTDRRASGLHTNVLTSITVWQAERGRYQGVVLSAAHAHKARHKTTRNTIGENSEESLAPETDRPCAQCGIYVSQTQRRA